MSTYSFIFRGRTCIVDVTMSGPTVSENSSMPNNELGDALRVLINEEVREVDRRQRVLAEWGMTREEVKRRQEADPEPVVSPRRADEEPEISVDHQRRVSPDTWIVRRAGVAVGIIVYSPKTADTHPYAFAWLTHSGYFSTDAEVSFSKALQTIIDEEGVDDAPAT